MKTKYENLSFHQHLTKKISGSESTESTPIIYSVKDTQKNAKPSSRHKLLLNYSRKTKIMMMVMRQKIIND